MNINVFKQMKRLERFSKVVMQQLEVRKLRLENEMLRTEKGKLEVQMSKDKMAPPRDDVTLMFTDIQSSTVLVVFFHEVNMQSLWENYPQEMHKALKMHDDCMRKTIAECFGYEITTEGDAFSVSFHSAFDAGY